MKLARTFSLAFALAILPAFAHAQRHATDNPYPQTKKTPVPAPKSITAKNTFYRDSLRAEFPVDSKGKACWRFLTEVSIPDGDGGFCFRDRDNGKLLDSVSVYGNMATYWRGKWDNITVDGRPGPLMFEWKEPGQPLRSSVITTTVGASAVRSGHP